MPLALALLALVLIAAVATFLATQREPVKAETEPTAEPAGQEQPVQPKSK